MQHCEYCGADITGGAVGCAGCGTPLAKTGQPGSCGQGAADVPLGRLAALGLALAVMWLPFLFCAALSGDKHVWRYLPMLPGAIPALVLHGCEQEWLKLASPILPVAVRVKFLHVPSYGVACYIASAIMTLAVGWLALALARRHPKVYELALAPALVVFCGMAFLTLLMLRA